MKLLLLCESTRDRRFGNGWDVLEVCFRAIFCSWSGLSTLHTGMQVSVYILLHAWVCGYVCTYHSLHVVVRGHLLAFGFLILSSRCQGSHPEGQPWQQALNPLSHHTGTLPLIIDLLGVFFLECSPKVSLQLNRYPHTPSNSLWATGNVQERTTFTNSNWIRGDMTKLPFTRARAWMTDQKKQFHSSLAWWTRVDWIVFSSQKLGWFNGSCITEKPSTPWAVTQGSCVPELSQQLAGISTGEPLVWLQLVQQLAVYRT